jgi:DNA-binding CsgD family transcriptional regulator
VNELLERGPALDTLARELALVRRGAGRAVLVAGEAGIGKSTLLERFLNSTRPDTEVVTGACDALFTPRPLGPLRDIALQWNDQALLDVDSDRHALFSMLLQRLRERRAPIVVAFEDMHWADEATLDLVKFLGRRIGPIPVLFILTYRDDEIGAQHPLRAVLGDLPGPTTTRIVLDRLSEAAVTALARASAGGEGPADLYALTEGNPFFVTEVLASGAAGVSPTLRDAVLARAARLSRPAREALDLAALSPGAVEGWLIEQCMSGADDALDECMACGMLAPVDARYVFRHELARLAVRDELSPQRRRSLSERLLRALESRPAGPESMSRLAHHAEDAGDRDAVVSYASAAGRSAASLGSHREAHAHFKRALAHAGALPARDRALLLETYAQECHAIGDMAGAIDRRREAAALWHALGDPRKEAENLSRQMISLVGAGRDSEAEAVSREAIALLDALPQCAELALAYRTQAGLRMLQRDNAEALAWGEKALALSEAFSDRETLVASLNTIGSALILSGDETRGCAYLEQSLAMAREARIESHISSALGNLGSGLGEVYRFDLADRYLAAAIEFATERDLDHSRLYALSWQANTRLYQGRWSEAAEAALAVLKSEAAATIARTMALLALGRLRARRGDAGAWDVLDQALALAERSGTLQRIAPVRAARAEAAWLEDDRDRAADEARGAYELALAKGHAWFVGELAYWQWKGGALDEVPAIAAEPYRLQMHGDAAQAEAAWQARNCPYEAARALAEADDEASLKRALQVFDRLGAAPAAERTRKRLRELGTRAIPRGPRAATRGNAFGLTARELEVVALLAKGLTNGAIAAKLHRSEKTVDHHVSAVLAKLDVRTREAAAQAAARHGLIPK